VSNILGNLQYTPDFQHCNRGGSLAPLHNRDIRFGLGLDGYAYIDDMGRFWQYTPPPLIEKTITLLAALPLGHSPPITNLHRASAGAK